MNNIKNEFVFNDYSKDLVSEFSKLKLKYNTSELRDALFENDSYQKFLGVIQNSYLKSIESDNTVNKIISSALGEKAQFNYSLLNNTYEQNRKDTNKNLFTYPDNFHSQFMSKGVAKRLENNRIFIVNFNYNLCGVNLELGFYTETKWFENITTDKSVKSEHNRIHQKIIRILRRIIFVIEFFKENTCSKNETLKFDLFLVKPEKKLPKKRMSKLTGENINSGYTTFYNDSENKKTIIIYRDEELEKLVIHEMIHFFYLDFYEINIDLSKYLNVPSNLEFIPNESYTEFITLMIHTGIMPIENEFKKAIQKNNNAGKQNLTILNTNNIYTKGIDKKVVFYRAIELLFNEVLFGYFQCAKILFQYNINSTKDFFIPLNSNKSKRVFFWQISCILSYFFVKVALFSNLQSSIDFFLKNQNGFKIKTSPEVKKKYEILIKNSLENDFYRENIQIALDKINSIIFNDNIVSQIKKKCASKKRKLSRCSRKLKATHKLRKSLKGKNSKVSNIVLTTRMSLFEL